MHILLEKCFVNRNRVFIPKIGYWVDGQRHGHGIMFYSDQTNYMGRWANDKRSGYGEGSALILTQSFSVALFPTQNCAEPNVVYFEITQKDGGFSQCGKKTRNTAVEFL